jgi:hypothetical protein
METEAEIRQSALDKFIAADTARGEGMTFQPLPSSGLAIFEPSRGAIPVGRARDEQDLVEKIKRFAAYNGEEWYYRFPVKNRKENRTDWIEGPSVKLANDLWRLYMNCDLDTRSVDLGESWCIYSRFTDLESGVSMTLPFIARKNAARLGGDDEGRRMEISFAIGAAKSRRNVVINALQTYSEMAFREAKQSLASKIGADLAGWRNKTVEKLETRVELLRVEAVIGRKAPEWLAPDIAKIIAMMKSIEDGFSSLDETFPPLAKPGAPVAQAASQTLEQFAKGDKQTPEPEPDAPTDGKGKRAAGEAQGKGADPAADIFAKLASQLDQAQSEAAVQEIWERLDLDIVFENDAKARGRAQKLCNDRIRDIGQ